MSGAIERIVVQLDAASENQPAIEAAARLAAHAEMLLHAVFVEDEDLLALASLPFARHVTLGAGTEPFTMADAELHLRAAAERARRDVTAAARRHRIKSSFAVVCGGTAHDTSERDLVVAGAVTRPIAGQFRTACRWWTAMNAASGPFLLARRSAAANGAIGVLLRDRGAASAQVLEAAAPFARAENGVMTVIVSSALAGFQKWLAERAADLGVRLQIEILPPEPAELQQRIGELDCRLLAIEAGIVEGGAARLRQFVERFACDILVVR